MKTEMFQFCTHNNFLLYLLFCIAMRLSVWTKDFRQKLGKNKLRELYDWDYGVLLRRMTRIMCDTPTLWHAYFQEVTWLFHFYLGLQSRQFVNHMSDKLYVIRDSLIIYFAFHRSIIASTALRVHIGVCPSACVL